MGAGADEGDDPMYKPFPLKGLRFSISPETQANVARAEHALVRMEDKALNGRAGGSLRRVLSRLEAVSAIRIEGKALRLMALLRLEACAASEGDARACAEPFDLFGFEREEERRAAVEVLRFERVLDRIYGPKPPASPFSLEDLLDIHSIACLGRPAKETGSGLRRRKWSVDGDSPAAKVYKPSPAEEVPSLVDDLVAFVRHEAYSPITQVAIAHFQFESIKPFKSGMDKTGRLMCHDILRRRGLMTGVVAPIGLEPAIDTASHAQALLPYNFGVSIDKANFMAIIDQWVDFCALSAEASARVADVYLDAILKVRESWVDDFGRPNKGSALEALLDLLPGTPVLKVRQAAALTGKSLSSANDALLRLERAGVVEEADRFQRGRLFVARRAVDVLEELAKRITPDRPVDRDSLA